MKISQTQIRPANQIQKTAYTPSFGKLFPIKLPFFKQDTVEISDDNIPAMSEKRLLPIIKSSMNSEHFIGSGSTAKVFHLKDSDYVAKIPYDTYFFVDKDFKKLPMYSSYKANHIEDVFENGITIMKYIKGDPLKRPDDFKKLVKLPAEAFNKLLKQVCDAKNYGLDLDGVPENFILNYDKKTITAIDFIPEYIYPEDNPPFRPLIDILAALCYSTIIATS